MERKTGFSNWPTGEILAGLAVAALIHALLFSHEARAAQGDVRLKTSSEVTQTLNHKVRSQVDECMVGEGGKRTLDMRCVVGGFVVYRGANPRVSRIEPCGDFSCGFTNVPARMLKHDSTLQRYSEVVFYHNRERWEELAVLHAERFVDASRRAKK